MANTYTQIYIHAVFHIRGATIQKNFQPVLYNYIGGILKRRGNKPLCIGGTHDHIHILFGLNPDVAISEIIKDIKTGSTRYINKNRYLINKFQWQIGFGGFSYSRSQISKVINYINKQEEHHKRRTFREEYIDMLKKAGVVFDEKFLL